jgi:hypothetical protein
MSEMEKDGHFSMKHHLTYKYHKTRLRRNGIPMRQFGLNVDGLPEVRAFLQERNY